MADDSDQHRPRYTRQATYPNPMENHSLNQRPSVPNIYTHAQSTNPLLKKRHSAYTLSTHSTSSPPLHFPVPPPLPDLRTIKQQQGGPARPPRHPGREQQGATAIPMNVRIPSSSASSIASGTVPPSPASSAVSYQHNLNQRRTSHSNLKKKSFVVGGGSSRPGTADSAMTSASSVHAAREWEWSGSASNVVGAGVIDENDDDEYGDNGGSQSFMDMGSIHSLTAQRERERVEVTPWEFQALPEESPVVVDHHDMETPGIGPGSSSGFQHRPRSIKTSRVSASSVPPPPVPQLPPSPMLMSAGSGTNASVFSIPHSASGAHSIKAGAGGSVISPSVATGPMDEVTPWDMYPVGVTNVNTSTSFQPNSATTPTSTKAPSSFMSSSNNNHGNLSSGDLRMGNNLNHSSVNLNSPVVGTKVIAPLGNVISPSVATGPMDEVTPWDMYPVPEGGSVTSSAGGASGERERAGSVASGGSAHGVTMKEEKKSSKGGALGKIKAAVKSASGVGEAKRQRRGSTSAGSAGGAPSVVSGASWASGSGAGLRPGQGQGPGGTTPTAYNTTFFPQPVPPPPVPAIPSSNGKPGVVQSMSSGNRNPSNSFSSVTSASTTASASTNATTPPNTPPLPSPAMPHMASSSSLSPTRAYFMAHPNHSAASANAGRGVTGSPRTTAAIYHSPSTSTLGSVVSAGVGGMTTGSAVDLSGHGQYTPTSAVHKKQSLISTSSIGGGGGAGSVPATPMTASSTAFSTSTIPHSIHTATTSTGVSSSSAMSVSSSGAGAGATATGPVEDVTPWEMYPVPAHTILAPPPPPVPKDAMAAAARKQRPRAGTVGSVVSASGKSGKSVASNGGGGGGSIGGSPNLNNSSSNTAYSPGGGIQTGDGGGIGIGIALGGPGPGLGSGASRKSLPYSERSAASSSAGYYKQQQQYNPHHNQQQQQQPQPQAKTGPTEEVTPWELEDTLPPPLAVVGLVRIESGGAGSTSSSLPGSGSVGNANANPNPNGGNHYGTSAAAAASSSSSGLGIGGGGGGGGSSGSGAAATSTSTSTRRARGSMTLEQLEEVMPWELSAPPPPSPSPLGMSQSQSQGQSQAQMYSSSGEETGGSGGVRERKSFKMQAPVENQPQYGKQSMQSTVSALHRSTFGSSGGGSGSAFADFGLRRRKSTGGGTANSKSGRFGKEKESKDSAVAGGGGVKDRKEKSRLSTSGQGGLHGMPSSNGMGISTSSPMPSGTSSTPLSAPGANGNGHGNSQAQKGAKFTTADRAILEQLKANLRARDEQFTIKGVGHTIYGQLKSPGKKYHAHPKEEVPYPRSYEREVLDLDVWETMFSLDICQSLTWHVFETPPTKVLEIGCGTGTWILQCARTWKECHFVGLDIVPLHPNLQNVGSPDLASRITWVQHNFLDTLPFQDEEFDFVHIKRIALGVPEDKWDSLFEEIARVMKPGGAFEMIEEDLFFPGRRNDDDDDQSILTMREDGESSTSRRHSFSSDEIHHHNTNVNNPVNNDLTIPRLVGESESSSQGRANDSDDHLIPPLTEVGTKDASVTEDNVQTSLRPPSVATFTPDQPSTPHAKSAPRPSLSVTTQSAGTSSNAHASIEGTLPPMFSTNVGLFGGIGYLASQDPLMEALKQQKRDRASMQPSLRRTPSFSGTATITAAPKTKISPFLIRSTEDDDDPTDPRDHAILAAVWTGMLESRFINTTPLSLLTTYLEYHFNDVRTHPPLLYTFPPVPPKVDPEYDDGLWIKPDPAVQNSEHEHDTDDARDAVIPMPKRARSTKSRKSVGSAGTMTAPDENGGEIVDDNRWLTMQSLMKKSSPYVSLDESRSHAYGPSSASLPTKSSKDGKLHGRRVTNLPNRTLHIDLRTLNLHLTLRAREIIACSEEMWEWVVGVQEAEKIKASKENEALRTGSLDGGFQSLSDSGSISSSLDFTNAAILEMTRDDFDLLLTNFDMDMQDRACLGPALKERFDWHIFPTVGVLQDRKAYDKACNKFDNWLARQPKNAAGVVTRQPGDNHRSRLTGLVPMTGLVPPTPETASSYNPSVISRSSSAPQPSTSNGSYQAVDGSVTTLVGSSSMQMQNEQDSEPPFSPSSTTPAARPTQMLSRAMRVFVAWKGTSSLSS